MAASAGDAHPKPIYAARYRVTFPILDADGDLVSGATSPDSEASLDAGTFADCTNEATEIATSSGMYYLDLTSAEMTAMCVAVIVKSGTGKTTPIVLYPERMLQVRSGTAQAGGASTITLDSGASAKDDFYNGLIVNVTNNSPANALGQARRITDYVGSTKVATVEKAWGTNPSSASTFEILVPENANVSAWAGTACADPDAVGYPVSTIKDGTGQGEIATTSGAVDTVTTATNVTTVNGLATNVITAAAINAGAITAAKFAAGAVDAAAIADGAIDSAAFAAGAINAAAIAADAITDAKVASDVTIASVTGAVGSVTAAVTVGTNNDKTGYGLSSAAVQAIWDALTSVLTTAGSIGKWLVDKIDVVLSTRASQTSLDAVDDYVDTEIAAIKAKTDNLPASPAATGDIPTVGAIADGVWDEAISGHLGAGSTGAALNAAGAAGDPWSTALPGAYGAGTAGKILGDNLDAAVSTRSTLGGVAQTGDSYPIVSSGVHGNAALKTIIDTKASQASVDTKASQASVDALPSAAQNADAVWDEAIAGHLGAGSTGAALNSAGGGSGESRNREGTAQGGGAATITLDAGASAVDDFYKNQRCFLDSGTGAGQCEIIDSYVGATKVATMAASWATAPSGTTTFRILPLGTIPGASAPSAPTVAAAVVDQVLSGHTTTGTVGGAIADAQADAKNRKEFDAADDKTTTYNADLTPRFRRQRQKISETVVRLEPVA